MSHMSRFDAYGELDGDLRYAVELALKETGAWGQVEVACARHALAAHAGRSASTVEALLAEADAVGVSSMPNEALEATAVALWHELVDDLVDPVEDWAAAYAAFAAVAAALAVAGSGGTAAVFEIAVSADEWTASFLASLAMSGAATWQSRSGDSAARRTFWEWWLGQIGASAPGTVAARLRAATPASPTGTVPPPDPEVAAVLRRASHIGHQLPGAGAFDNGIPGQFFASHSELKMNELRPGRPMTVSTPMCRSCHAFLASFANATGTTVRVQDPLGKHDFAPTRGRRRFALAGWRRP